MLPTVPNDPQFFSLRQAISLPSRVRPNGDGDGDGDGDYFPITHLPLNSIFPYFLTADSTIFQVFFSFLCIFLVVVIVVVVIVVVCGSGSGVPTIQLLQLYIVHCTHTSSTDNDVSSEATRAQLLVAVDNSFIRESTKKRDVDKYPEVK
jgi:hypothetical protein